MHHGECQMSEIENIIKILRTSKNPQKRREAADLLLNLGERNPKIFVTMLPAFIDALNDGDEGVVRRAAYAIYKASIVNPAQVAEYIPYLLRFFTSGISRYPNPNITSYGAYASIANVFGVVGERNPRAVAGAIKPMTACLNYPLYHPENPHSDLNKLYASVIRSLGRIGHMNPALVKDAVPSIIKALNDSFKYKSFMKENPRDKTSLRWAASFAVDAIGTVAPQLIVPHLVKCLTDSKKPIRDYGMQALNKLAHDPAKVIPPLIQCLSDERPSIREEATKFLVKIGLRAPKYVIPALVTCFKSKNPLVKQHAALALGDIGKNRPNDIKSAIPALLEALRAENKEVRQQAADALFKIAEVNLGLVVQGVRYFINALKDPYHHVRWRAVMIIGMIGEKNPLAVKDAVPILANMFNDPQDHVRWRAEEALKKMRVDKGKYLMAAKGIELARKLINESKESGKDITKAEEYLNMALDAMDEMKYSTAIEFADKAKEASLSSPTIPPTPTDNLQPPQQHTSVPKIRSTPTELTVMEQISGTVPQETTETDRIYCPYCGAENYADFNFCIRCRRKLPKLDARPTVNGGEGIPTDKETKYRIYRSALEEAWKDGALRAEEMAMLERLRTTLGLSPEEHQVLELEIRKKLGFA